MIADIIICGLIIAGIYFAIKSIKKNKNSCSSCGGCCNGCSSCNTDYNKSDKIS